MGICGSKPETEEEREWRLERERNKEEENRRRAAEKHYRDNKDDYLEKPDNFDYDPYD